MSLAEQLENLITEEKNPRTTDLDVLNTVDLVRRVQAEDFFIAESVQKAIPQIAQAVDLIVESLNKGGRLIYFGAGTSGRLGILDASECPPTFGVELSLISGFIAGGKAAVFQTSEGAEDHEELGEADIDTAKIGKNDVVCGITASGRTPYVIGALRKAKELGAHTVSVSNNEPKKESKLMQFSDVAIVAVTGPEAIAGSTRMKAGTAQKMVLNLLTSCSMVRLGKVYDNLMVDLTPSSFKLKQRATTILCLLCKLSREDADKILAEAGNNVKIAVLMHRKRVTLEEARSLLTRSGNSLRRALTG